MITTLQCERLQSDWIQIPDNSTSQGGEERSPSWTTLTNVGYCKEDTDLVPVKLDIIRVGVTCIWQHEFAAPYLVYVLSRLVASSLVWFPDSFAYRSLSEYKQVRDLN